MTTVAAPVRARTATRTPPARRGAKPSGPASAPRTQARAASPRAQARSTSSLNLGRVGAVLVVATIAALVLAVVFHVVLAQRQMQLDNMNVRIAREQRAYEKNRLMESLYSSPQRIIEEGQRLGLVLPAEPATYLQVPGAPQPSARSGEPSTTLDEYGKVKSELGAEQP